MCTIYLVLGDKPVSYIDVIIVIFIVFALHHKS
jgi:hypothetical protein